MEIGNKELQELEQRMKKEKSRRMFERYQTIHLYVNGTDTKQIAFIVGRTEETIKSYIHAYQNHGLKGLHMKVSPGAPNRVSTRQSSFNGKIMMTLDAVFRPHENQAPDGRSQHQNVRQIRLRAADETRQISWFRFLVIYSF